MLCAGRAGRLLSYSGLAADMLEGLLWWSKLAGVPAGNATLVYAGREAFTRSEVAVRPWFAI